MHTQKRSNRGFTLIELMLVVAVLGIIVLIAAPSFQRAIHSNQLRTETSRLLSALNLARSEAISRNAIVSLCPSRYASDGVAACSKTYADGWIIFTNSDRDRVVDEGSDNIVKAFEGLPAGYSLTNKTASKDASELISYRPDGSSRRNMTLLICSPRDWSILSWSVVLNMVGRPRVARGWGQCQ